MLKPNVGHINYLNCLPLTYTFTKNPSDKFNLFKDVPVLFCGINNFSKKNLENLPFENISGVAEEVDIEKSV